MDRRAFLRSGATLAPSLAGLAACTTRRVAAADRGAAQAGGYGPLAPSADCAALALPAGFRCVLLSTAGQPMTNGQPTPPAFDGMAAYPLPNGNIRLIRNHEVTEAAATVTPIGDAALAYDAKAGGGTTSLEVRVRPDGARELVREFVSLGGTAVNCAGGPTPWGSWMTCEETTDGPRSGRLRRHGYVFDVPASAEAQVAATPIVGMGRFSHEALAVDPATRITYLTEDGRFAPSDPAQPGSGFYRYVPRRREAPTGAGRLQMLAVRGYHGYNTTSGQTAGLSLRAHWVDIPEPDAAGADTDQYAVFRQGLERGGAIFQRLEGCWYGDRSIYFDATTGGDARCGQIWQYQPRGGDDGRLVLVYESPSRDVLDSPDNIVVSPRGGLVICEDGPAPQFVRGLTRDGRIFDFAQNLANASEFCGACFSPDGRTLFVNIQGARLLGREPLGMTFAIWGPWERGAL